MTMLTTPGGKISARSSAELQRGQRRLLGRLQHHGVAGGQRRGRASRPPSSAGSSTARSSATTPTGSRRIMLVKPGRYSPATAPVMQRAAPAKKRNTSTIAGISSPSAAPSGLPQLQRLELREGLRRRASMRSASLSSSAARSFGGCATSREGGVGGRHRGLDLRPRGLGHAREHLAGRRVQDVLDLALAGDELAVDEEFGLHVQASLAVLADSAAPDAVLRPAGSGSTRAGSARSVTRITTTATTLVIGRSRGRNSSL